MRFQMKIFILAALLAGVAVVTAEFEQEWYLWKKEYGKEYKDEVTERMRHDNWVKNAALIKEHNDNADKHGYTLGMNHFGDMTQEEVVKVFNGYQMRKTKNNNTKLFERDPNYIPEDTVDWRDKGAVTPVKNQGQCGSCWSFSATGSLEGQHFLKNGQLVSLSEQNLIDCSKDELNNGCKGGLMVRAFEYVIQNGGIDTEKSYPYQAHDEKCRYRAIERGATERNYKNIKQDSTQDLVDACGSIGPISVAMDASRQNFHFYKQGVYKDMACSSTNLDHGVLLVGYGTYEGEEYFLVKNSWGTAWGMEGYFMISRKGNMCGLATEASYPIV